MAGKTVELSRRIEKYLSKGENSQRIINDLIKQGWTEPDAIGYVDEIGQGIENDSLNVVRRLKYGCYLYNCRNIGIGVFNSYAFSSSGHTEIS